MVGLSSAHSARACRSTPPTACRPTADRPSGPDGSPNTFSPEASLTDRCTWKPDPPSSLNGLAIKVASSPWCRAISCTADLSRNDRSAASASSEWPRLISNWPGELVVGRGDLQSRVPQLPEHVQQHALRVALAPDHVHVPQVVGVPLPPAAGRRLAQVELKLGAADQGVAEAGDPVGHPAGHGAR